VQALELQQEEKWGDPGDQVSGSSKWWYFILQVSANSIDLLIIVPLNIGQSKWQWLCFRLDFYDKRVKGTTDIDEQMTRDLTEMERHLLDTQEMIVIRGKVSGKVCSHGPKSSLYLRPLPVGFHSI